MRTVLTPSWRARIAVSLGFLALVTVSLPQQKKQATRPPAKAQQAAPDAHAEAIRSNNLGVAYMNQQRMEQALKLFQQALAQDVKLDVARMNEGIALLNLQRNDAALAALLEAGRSLPESPRVWYNLGLLYKNNGDVEKGITAFERAAKFAPEDADAHYFIGTLYLQAQKYDQSITAFERALELNSLHVSAEFGLSRAWQRKGDSAKSREHLARFQKLTQEKLGAPMSLAYGDQGRLSLAGDIISSATSVPQAIPLKFVAVPAAESGLDFKAARASTEKRLVAPGACVLDYDNDGRPDLLVLNADEPRGARLFHNEGGKFKDVTSVALPDARGDALACVAGDYDNDGFVDLVIGFRGGVELFHNEKNGTFRKVTTEAGIRSGGDPLVLLLLDYDHDGDLDLFVSAIVEERVVSTLWRNNGNRTFTNWTAESGLANLPALGVAASDINNDRAVDFVLTGGEAPSILLNPREGAFRRATTLTAQMAANAVGVAVFDFDHDGWMDLAFTHSNAPGVTLWRNREGKKFERVSLPALPWSAAAGIVAFDYDNDGWVDLAVSGRDEKNDELRVFRNLGKGGFADVTKEVGLAGLSLEGPVSLVAADVDGDGAADLVVTHRDGVLLLRNDGGNKNNSLRVSLKGLADNKSALGTKVEVFSGANYQKFEVTAPNDLMVGLGREKQADIVRMLWPTGVVQDEIGLRANERQAIAELDRRGSSCPILFAWNGSLYEFIADAIGPGIIGHWVAPGERNIPDPTEYLKVDGARVRSRDGRLSFRFMEPMEELVYLDQVRLLAVDHPGDVAVYPNERFSSGPPFPEFKVIASRSARPPAGAWDDRGRDVLPKLLLVDRSYVTGFADAPFKGFAETHSLVLDLGETVGQQTQVPLRLLMHGFTDYFTATSVYAAYQAGVTPIAPYVEALDSSGRWVRIVDDMGFPAGLSRTMVADLTGRLPAGTRRIRIVTNLKIYWDQILIDTTPDAMPIRISQLPLETATLSFRGYPRELHGNPPADISYNYQEISRSGPYARAAGNYTRYGDVRSLLSAADDQFVIFGSGDEVAIDFNPSQLPALRPGWTRDYFFFVDGFSKDMDFYAAYPFSVDPLPFHKMREYPYGNSEHYPAEIPFLDYLLRFNTRGVSGRPASSLRFAFHSPGN